MGRKEWFDLLTGSLLILGLLMFVVVGTSSVFARGSCDGTDCEGGTATCGLKDITNCGSGTCIGEYCSDCKCQVVSNACGCAEK